MKLSRCFDQPRAWTQPSLNRSDNAEYTTNIRYLQMDMYADG